MNLAKKRLFIFICVFLLLKSSFQQSTIVTASSICQDSTFQNLLQSGTYSLTNQRNSNSRVNNFQIVVNYNIPSWGFNVIVSTGRINGFNQAAGTDYSIRGSRLDNTNIANFVLLINQDSSWTSIRASFLISSRSDFFLGAFLPDTINFSSAGSSSMIANYYIPNWSSASTSVNFVYLISGLRTSDNSYSVSLSDAKFNTQNGLISLTINSNAIPFIQTIYISYLVFLNSAPYTFSKYEPLSSSIPAATNFYQGINAMTGNSIAYEGYAINATPTVSSTIQCIGSNCPASCVTPLRCTSNGGLIAFNKCFMCGFQETFSNGQCNLRCSGNETWSGNACICKTGYVRVNGQCRIINCNSGQIWNGIQCICADGYQRIGGTCQFICPSFSSWNGVQCICNSGYTKVNSRCAFQCASNAYLNESGSCVCLPNYFRNSANQCVTSSCSQNQIFDTIQSKCICRQGYLFSRNQCLVKCPGDFTNAVIYQGTCVCIEGYDVVNGRCVRSISCNKQFQILFNNQCTCIGGYQYNSLGLCIPNCKENEVLQGENCQCISGFGRNAAGFCVAVCPVNQYLANNICTCIPSYTRNSRGICVKVCGQNQSLVNNQCVCNVGYVRNSASGACVLACGLNQVLINNKCQCSPGFIKLGQICVSICRVNEVYDIPTKQCVCKEGYGINPTNNLCDVCPANSRSTGLLTGCICNNGYKYNSATQRCQFIICQPNSSLQSNGQCVCNTGYYLEGTQCKKIPTCPPRSSWTSSFVCKCDSPSQYLINNVCQPCRPNSAWNGTQCKCLTGFFLVSGNCIQCSGNSQYLRGNCVCNFGFYGDGVTCNPCHPTCGTCSNNFANSCLTCANVSYTLSNGFCNLKACDSGYFFNPSASSCDKCPGYCSTCSNATVCTKCNDGFQFNYTFILGDLNIGCEQICGDGKQFYRNCDDGNSKSGDGCSTACEVQQGWTCVGGSATSKSQCYNIIPTSSFIIPGGNVALDTEVLQGISMTYLPQNLTANNCSSCNNILNISIISASSVPRVSISYITATQYKFVARFNFGVLATNQFLTFSIRINPSFSGYFSATDMQQVKIVTIDLAKLAKYQAVGTLSLTQPISTQVTSSSNNNQDISIPGLPASGVAILFPN